MIRALILVPVLLLAACGDFSPPETVKRGLPIRDRALDLRVQQEMRYLKHEVEQRQAIHDEWPEDWSFIHRSARDPWGHEYAYVVEDGRAIILCAGPDGEFETLDDIRGS